VEWGFDIWFLFIPVLRMSSWKVAPYHVGFKVLTAVTIERVSLRFTSRIILS
jgi:hypothetical protein